MEKQYSLIVKNLHKTFGGLTAVNHLDMTVETGKISALIGPNGSGKTTTINLISGALNADEGEVLVDGHEDIVRYKEYLIARLGVRRTFQNLKLFNSMNALENVMMGGQNDDFGIIKFIFNPIAAKKNETALKERALEAMKFLNLEHLANHSVGDLPYGQQKKLEIARAIMVRPKLLLLDEPATGLNPTERQELVDVLYKIKEDGMTILVIEHNMDVIMTVSDHITVLNFGTKIAEGCCYDIQNNDEVIEAYLGAQFKKKKAEGGAS